MQQQKYRDLCFDDVRFREYATGKTRYFCTGKNNTCTRLVDAKEDLKTGVSYRRCWQCFGKDQMTPCQNPKCDRQTKKGNEFCYKCRESNKEKDRDRKRSKQTEQETQLALVEALEFNG